MPNSKRGAAYNVAHHHTNDGPSLRRKDRLNDLLNDRDRGVPIWIRPPNSGPEHFTGISRSKLYELSGKRLIRSVSIREPGQIKGTRLFHLQSILDFIER